MTHKHTKVQGWKYLRLRPSLPFNLHHCSTLPSLPTTSAPDHSLNISLVRLQKSLRLTSTIHLAPGVRLAAAKLLDVGQTREGETVQYCERLVCVRFSRYTRNGKLHHYIGLLSCEKDGEELQAVYPCCQEVRFYILYLSLFLM